jgi:N-acetylmuramoyl-L-alanine amidase
MTQRIFLKYGVLFTLILFSLNVSAQRGEKITTVVIDAGHGGKDPGALGKISREKDINLAVAKKTGNYIKKYLPDVKVIYTRQNDVFVPLSERASIANRNKADVFISIHCNSTEHNTTVCGTETFVMGESKSEANLEVAKLENSAILYEENASDEYGNFDLNSPEAYIALSLFQSEYQSQSLQLAEKVQRQFTERVGRKSRGVQQNVFLVLVRTSMPSILVELGFLSNAEEERFLASEDGQVYMASAIYRAFKDYKIAFETENTVNTAPATSQKPEVEKEGIRPQVKADSIAFKVQFASKDKKIPVNDKMFRKIEWVDVYEMNGSYKYTSGCFATRSKAAEHQAKMKKMGYDDAFVVAFLNGERVSIKEAENAISYKK